MSFKRQNKCRVSQQTTNNGDDVGLGILILNLVSRPPPLYINKKPPSHGADGGGGDSSSGGGVDVDIGVGVASASADVVGRCCC